jgi:hypothetical protein
MTDEVEVTRLRRLKNARERRYRAHVYSNDVPPAATEIQGHPLPVSVCYSEDRP